MQALNNEGPLKQSLIWNSGFYFWISGLGKSLEECIQKAESSIASGAARKILMKLIHWRSNNR